MGKDYFGVDYLLNGIYVMLCGDGMLEMWFLGLSIEIVVFVGVMGIVFCYVKFIVGNGE